MKSYCFTFCMFKKIEESIKEIHRKYKKELKLLEMQI